MKHLRPVLQYTALLLTLTTILAGAMALDSMVAEPAAHTRSST